MKPETLGNFWNNFCELPVLQRQWPAKETLAALPALQSCDHDCAQRLERRFEFVHSFSILPIVAVAGLKNAGKSSLVSAFVSPANRDRIPRGLKSDFGTHRFTLWLPQSWEANTDRLAQIKTTLAEVFGHAAEALSDSAEDAIRQQTRRDTIEKPLLAFDPALEEQGIALLDCPDIDSASGDTPENNARLRMLTRAGEVCAGVIIVIERAKIEVDLLSVIAQHLPAAAQVYAINGLRNEPPHEVLEDLERRLGHRPQYCFMAFDYAVEGYRERTPRIDPNLASDPAAKLVKLPY